jgi:hypothetical protein
MRDMGTRCAQVLISPSKNIPIDSTKNLISRLKNLQPENIKTIRDITTMKIIESIKEQITLNSKTNKRSFLSEVGAEAVVSRTMKTNSKVEDPEVTKDVDKEILRAGVREIMKILTHLLIRTTGETKDQEAVAEASHSTNSNARKRIIITSPENRVMTVKIQLRSSLTLVSDLKS